MFRYRIGSRTIELDESVGEINSKSRIMTNEGFIDCISHYRSPKEADPSVAGDQKSNLYTKLSIYQRTNALSPGLKFSQASMYSKGYNNISVSDRELLYYAIYLKKDIPPGSLIKVMPPKNVPSKITYFKVKK